MNNWRIALLGAAAVPLLATAAMPAAAQTSNSIQPSEDARQRQEEAMALAQTVQPRDIVVDLAIAALDKSFVKTATAQPEFADLERQYPGILAAYWTAAKPELGKLLASRLPTLWDQLAKFYAENLTLSELRVTRAFYAGETGQKIVRIMNSGFAIEPLLQDILRNPDSAISQSAYQEMLNGSLQQLGDRMTPADLKAVSDFMRSGVGSKLQRLTPQVQRLGLEWMNASDPEADARMEAIAIEAFERFIAAKEGRSAGQ